MNDLLVKGRVATLNLVKMMLRFMVGKEACQGDMKQFYASIKLIVNQWHLQRVLFRENFDPDGELLECIIKTLIWGIKCVSAQSECSIIKLAEAIKEDFPLLAKFLMNGRFVDDLGSSAGTKETLETITKQADVFFDKLGLACKGWTFSGSNPPPEVAEEGNSVKIAGMIWYSLLDLLEIPLPELHFSNKSRGRLVAGAKVYNGSISMEEFVPEKLTRRMIVSKNASIFDLPGKLVPVLTALKVDVSEAIKETKNWDDPVSPELRSKWVQNFLKIEQLRGIKFNRAIMPPEAIDTKMNLITGGDSAKVKIVGSWGRFKLKDGRFSCQLLLGRSLLGSDETLPKDELDALMMGCNLSWVVRQALDDWVDSHIELSDSTISLCWTISEKKRLSIYHRNRCVQIRRSTELENLYHCISEENPCDVGTRPDVVDMSDIGPLSKWENGLPWMNGSIEDAVKNGILTPALDLKLNTDEEKSFKEGMIFEKSKEILTPGHPAVMLASRTESVQARYEYSNYLLSPTKFKFEKCVRIYSIVWKFVRSFKCVKGKLKSRKDDCFKMFVVQEVYSVITPIVTYKEGSDLKHFNLFGADYTEQIKSFRGNPAVVDINNEKENLAFFDSKENIPVDVLRIANLSFGCENPGIKFKGKYHILLTNEDVSMALGYLFRKGSLEVKRFCKQDFLAKISVESDEILYSKSRILDTMRFHVEGGLDENILGLGALGIKSKTPLLDRYSPLSYSIGDYIHRVVARHGGYERCYRDSLNHVFIIHGLSLFREIGSDCVKCDRLRKRYLDVEMGPIGDQQLIIAPPFYTTMCDIFGPCKVYVPGHSMATRGRKAIDVKAYVLVFICPTTKCINLQVIEGKSADAIIEGVIRLGCEVGMPSFVLVDQDSGIIKVLREAEVDIRNVDMVLCKERGIRFRTCPVSGHNMHGAVERRIRTVQECLEKSDFENMRLHSCGLQTLLKLVENEINNLPLGYSFGRDANNSPLLKLIFPNMLKIGRNNQRALDGPIRMPTGPGEMLKKIETGYAAFYKIFNSTMVPKLLSSSKWFRTGEQLQVDDLVLFQKEENELSSKWTLGKIVAVEKSRDGLVRRATVQYQNPTEDFSRTTDRATRSLVKLMHIDDTNWLDDISEVEKLFDQLRKEESENDDKNDVDAAGNVQARGRLDATSGHKLISREKGVQNRPLAKSKRSSFLRPCNTCCCISHCLFYKHSKRDEMIQVAEPYMNCVVFDGLLDRSWATDDVLEEQMKEVGTNDPFMSLLCSTNLNLDDDAFTCDS